MKSLRNILLVILFAPIFAFAADPVSKAPPAKKPPTNYRWKSGDTIWYVPSQVYVKKTTESYDPCDEMTTQMKGWTRSKSFLVYGGDCALIPPQSEAWVKNYLQEQTDFEKTEKTQAEKPPDERTSDEKIRADFDQIKAANRKNCPKDFDLYVRYEDTNEVHTKPGTVICSGLLSECRDGFNFVDGHCDHDKFAECPKDSIKDINGECVACERGGSLDKNEKRMSIHCDVGPCIKQQYCKVNLKDLKPSPK